MEERMQLNPLQAMNPQESLRSQAMAQITTFMCNTCNEPYCGGRVECSRQQDLSSSDMMCGLCEWSTHMGEAKDQRCMLHGHRFAVFKCDFCCAVATYRCGGNANFCDRCHEQAYSNI